MRQPTHVDVDGQAVDGASNLIIDEDLQFLFDLDQSQ